MGLLDILRGKRWTEPPTEKQLKYAKKLGIEVTPTMSKQDVSGAISRAAWQKEQKRKANEPARQKRREQKYGKELVEAEAGWNALADAGGYILAVYRKGKQVIVDVVMVREAWIEDPNKLVLGLAAPKVTKDRDLGAYLEWERDFELPISKLLYDEAVDVQSWADENREYKLTVERGLKIARKL